MVISHIKNATIGGDSKLFYFSLKSKFVKNRGIHFHVNKG